MKKLIMLLVFAVVFSLCMSPARATITCTGTDSTKNIAVGDTGDITVSCSGISQGTTVTVNAQYSSNCLSAQDNIPFSLTYDNPSTQITFEATSMSCQYNSDERTITWSFAALGESISSQQTLVTITSPLTVTTSFKNAPYSATAGNSVTVILEISTGASVDITDVDADMSGTDSALYPSKITDWNDNTIYSSGSQKTIQKSWTFTVPSTAGAYTISTTVTSQNAGGDQESTTLSVSAAGGPGGPDGGPSGGGLPPTDEEAQNESRKPELVPGVGLRNNTKLQAAIEKVLGIANMSEQARENLMRLSQSISSEINMTREINVGGGTSKMTTKMKYFGDKKVTNFIFFDSVPKTFASSASDITVTAPGATYEVVEEDPGFVFLYPELTFGQEVIISYEVNEEVDTSVIDEFSGEVYAEGLEEFVCEIGQKRCVGDNVEECNDNRSGWVFVETCPYGCLNGACLPSTEIPFWLLWVVVVIIIIVIVIIAGLAISRRKKKPKFKFKSEIPSGSPSSPESEDISRF